MTADAGLPAGSRAVLIGVSAYEYAEFPPIRAARNSLHAMQSVLADPAMCGWPPELITLIANPISAADLASQIADLAEAATGVLLVYYVGHGMLSTRGELCLTVTSTRPNRPKITGLPWETLADVLRTCPARTRLVILDCCFAGQAIEALGADSGQSLADITHIEGVYTLTATTRNRTAHVPPPDQQDTACTSFTGELHDLIRSGIPGKPSLLTFSDIYPELRQRLRVRGLPAPNQRSTETAHQFPFAANMATRTAPTTDTIELQGDYSRRDTSKNPEPVRIGQPRLNRVLTDALRAAWSINDAYWKALALASITRAMAATDLDRAMQLAADTERIARSISSRSLRELALARIAEALAVADADLAESMAESISGAGSKASALSRMAKAMAATDPDSAARLAGNAEKIIRWLMRGRSYKAPMLARIAEVVAATDPDRAAELIAKAEHIAESITDENSRSSALASTAEAVVATALAR